MKILTDDYMNEHMYLLCRCVLVLVLIYTNIKLLRCVGILMSILINISILIKHIRIRPYKRVILIVMLVLA